MRAAPCLRACAGVILLGLLGCFAGNDVTRAPPAPTRTAVQPLVVPATLATGRLPGTARPIKYSVSLAIDPTKDRFLGDVAIQVDVPATTQAIVLHGRELAISRAEVFANGETQTAATSFRAAGSKEA